ncbi:PENTATRICOPEPTIDE REPEAT-CONTAINING PROTEIN 1 MITOCHONDRIAL [Salix viminalis]|uniref:PENTATRICOPEPTIDE REPEAT-CONTAINING PROTEIN 1 MITOCHONDRIAL n=1 Tax=Salix viminalis TaxID=40686 RepID=A0A9Q0QK90_SALVM|nr:PENTATRICOPEPTIDE REPEAT-CONTAINING PROTEIN 1 MITOCHONDRIAL [Salix viminalis]
MIKRRLFCHALSFKPKKGPITSTCAVSLDPQPIPNDHTSLCQSLVHDLLGRGLLSSAQKVVQRFIASSPTVHDAIFAVEFASASGMDLGPGISGELMRKLVDLGHPLSAHEFYHDRVVAGGIEPDSNIVNSLATCLAKLGKLDDAVKLFDRLIGSGDCVASNAACSTILKGYVGEAIEVLDIMCRITGLPPTLHMLKTLFYGLCKRGWSIEAEWIFEEMEALGFFVDKVMYTSLMNAYGKDRKMKMAMRVYFRMLKNGYDPDICTCNTLIYGFSKMGLFDKAWVLYNLMNDWGIQPNEVTYSIMIHNYCKKGKLDCAMSLLNSMAPCNLTPCVHCYTPIMVALYKQNRCFEVDEWCERMLESGVVPDHVLFFVLMKNKPKGLGIELQLCLLMLQAIAKNGCGLDCSSTINSDKINSTLALEQEIELLLKKIARSDLNLGNVAGGIYVSALCEGGKTEAALACLENMVIAGCAPLLFTFNSLIKRLFQDGLSEDVKSLIEIMQNWGISPNLQTYLIMVNEYCKQEDLALAFGILEQMEEMGLKPNVAIYDCIIACLSQQRRISEAETLFHRMLENGVDPDEVAYMTMINAYARNGKGVKALHLYEMMIENAVQPNSYSYTALTEEDACHQLGLMQEEGLRPNEVLSQFSLVHMAGLVKLIGVLNRMNADSFSPDRCTYNTSLKSRCRLAYEKLLHYFCAGRMSIPAFRIFEETPGSL